MRWEGTHTIGPFLPQIEDGFCICFKKPPPNRAEEGKREEGLEGRGKDGRELKDGKSSWACVRPLCVVFACCVVNVSHCVVVGGVQRVVSALCRHCVV